VARLDSSKRANLPNTAFAYVDASGRRRLPIHDEAHVRNALARFGQVVFEDEAAREVARKRLLNAAKRYKIVPVGFITGQLESEREIGRRRAREPFFNAERWCQRSLSVFKNATSSPRSRSSSVSGSSSVCPLAASGARASWSITASSVANWPACM